VDVLLVTVTTRARAAGASAPFRAVAQIRSDIAPGAGMIRIGADATNAVSESNERNNTAEFPITITGGPF
jgi:subtilase family serine protease